MEYGDISDRYGSKIELAEIEQLETDSSPIYITIEIIDTMDKGRNYFIVRVSLGIDGLGLQDIEIHPYDLVKFTEKYPIDIRIKRVGISASDVEPALRHIVKSHYQLDLKKCGQRIKYRIKDIM